MISIIIPVYNVAPYLDECIASVVNQTYQDWECVLVDDGSTDGGAEICDNWSKKDDRIIVVHQSNQGVSAARNQGIDKACGEFITFIDSDDYVTPTYLSSMLAAEKADLIVSGIVRQFANVQKDEEVYQPIRTEKIILGKTATELFVDLNQKFLLFGPCTKLYKTSIIKENDIVFPTGCSLGEDLEFNCHYIQHVHTISCIAISNYFYRILGEGSLSSIFRKDQFDIEYRQWKMQQAIYKDKNMWYLPAKKLLYRRLWEIVYGGLFRGVQIERTGWKYISHILQIPEIRELRQYDYLYPCAEWIKWAVCHRLCIVFYGYYLYSKRHT